MAITVAPNALASWMAVVPMPEVPPWTSSVSPGLQAPALEHVVPDREIGLGEGRRLDHVEAGGDGQRVDLVNHARNSA